MRLQLHKPHDDHLTSKEKEKRKLLVKSAVTLRALNTFFSTTGYPSESSSKYKRRFVRKQKDCFCLRMWRDLNKTLGVHYIEVSLKRELAVVTEPVNRGPHRKETINLVSYLLNCGPYLLPTFPSPPPRASLVSGSRAEISSSLSRFNAWHEGYRDPESFVDNLPSASYAGCYTIIVKHHHKMPKSRQKSDAKSSNEEQEEVTVVDIAVVEASSEPRG